MTLEAFEALYLNELAGMLYDAQVNQRSGRDFAMWYRAQYQQLRVIVRKMYAEFEPKTETPKPAATNNGTAHQKEKK